MISDFPTWLETVGNRTIQIIQYFSRVDGFTFNYSKFADIDTSYKDLGGQYIKIFTILIDPSFLGKF